MLINTCYRMGSFVEPCRCCPCNNFWDNNNCGNWQTSCGCRHSFDFRCNRGWNDGQNWNNWQNNWPNEDFNFNNRQDFDFDRDDRFDFDRNDCRCKHDFDRNDCNRRHNCCQNRCDNRCAVGFLAGCLFGRCCR